LLANASHAASVQGVENAGFPAVATSSRAIAQVLGEVDEGEAVLYARSSARPPRRSPVGLSGPPSPRRARREHSEDGQ